MYSRAGLGRFADAVLGVDEASEMLGEQPLSSDASHAVSWRKEQKASIRQTAEHFGISAMSVKRYCAEALAA